MRTHVRLEDSEDLETPHFPETVDTWSPLTTEEVRKAINKAGDTTPGPDAAPNAALKLAWPHLLGDAITAMYNLSLEWSIFQSNPMHCPQKETQMESEISYRPIALLATLGKGLKG